MGDIKTAKKKLKESINLIAKERDNLRAILEEYDDILSCTSEALELLNEGVDRLSEEL